MIVVAAPLNIKVPVPVLMVPAVLTKFLGIVTEKVLQLTVPAVRIKSLVVPSKVRLAPKLKEPADLLISSGTPQTPVPVLVWVPVPLINTFEEPFQEVSVNTKLPPTSIGDPLIVASAVVVKILFTIALLVTVKIWEELLRVKL